MISRVELQGQIANSQEFTNIKHHEDAHPAVQQTQIVQENDKAAEVKLSHVNDTEAANNQQDASHEGSSQYAGDGGRNRRNARTQSDGKVVVKGQQRGFDLKI